MNIVSLVRGILGLSLILGIAFLFSNNRRRISWRLVSTGIALQVVMHDGLEHVVGLVCHLR